MTTSEQTLPALQESLNLSGSSGPPHRTLYRQRARRPSHGSEHLIPDNPNTTLPSAASGLQALLTPTLGTHPGGTVLGKIGVGSGGPRIVIPLPAALATATAMATGTLPPGTAAKDAQSQPLPSMLIDSEWFSLDAYPQELHQYLATNLSFDLKPTNPGEIVKITQVFLRSAYTGLTNVGIEVKIASGLKELFDELVLPNGNVPKHPYGENELINNLYLILAYVLSTQLWTLGKTRPLREYPEVTYPGVIAAAYVSRLTTYYQDISKALNSGKPYLEYGGYVSTTDTDILVRHGQEKRLLDRENKRSVLDALPELTFLLRISAEYATGRRTDIVKCSDNTWKALQSTALNVRGVDETIAKNTILIPRPDKTNPLAQNITDARCAYFLGLIRGTITPGTVASS